MTKPFRNKGRFAFNPNPTQAQLRRRQRDAARKAGTTNEPSVRVTSVRRIKPAKRRMVNIVGYITDNSQSMVYRGLQTTARRMFEESLNNHATESKNTPNQDTYLTHGAFGNHLVITESGKGARDFRYREPNWGQTGGGTALYKVFCEVVKDMEETGRWYAKYDVSYLLYFLTDGENQTEYSYGNKFNKTIARLNSAGNWTIGFMGPKSSQQIYRNAGIPDGNVMFWETADDLTCDVAPTVRASTQAFYNTRSTGAKSTQNLFLDLSKVDKGKFTESNNVSSKFQSWRIERGEEAIEDFVNYKLKNLNVVARVGDSSYKIGSGYYELTKKETIQPSKKILVQDKKTGIIIDGESARDLLGIKGNARVDPQNLSFYKVFVQSTSPNRKLVRGTTLLYLKSKTTPARRSRRLLGNIAHS